MDIGQSTQPALPRYCGRDRLLAELAQGLLSPEPFSFALVGAKLVGKSSLLRFLASEQGPLRRRSPDRAGQDCFSSAKPVIILLLDCAWPMANGDLLENIYTTLAQQLRASARELDWKAFDEQLHHDQRLWQLLHQLNQRQQRLILLLDNFAALLTPPSAATSLLLTLHRLMGMAALVITTDQPLYDLGGSLAESSLVDDFTQHFLGLLDPEAAEHWLNSYQTHFPGLSTIQTPLSESTGRHPFLLRKLGDCLAEVQHMLPPRQLIGADQLAILRLRLAEHARPLFITLWHNLQNPPAYIAPAIVMAIIEELMIAPLAANQVRPEQFSTLNWLINQAIVMYCEYNDGVGYQLFSPLFAEFIHITGALTPAKQLSPSLPTVASGTEAPIYENLTKMEATLLRYFLNHNQSVVSTDQLLTEVWKRPDSSTRRVQEAIRRLRLQLEQQTPPIGVIENERGRGYRFIPAEP